MSIYPHLTNPNSTFSDLPIPRGLRQLNWAERGLLGCFVVSTTLTGVLRRFDVAEAEGSSIKLAGIVLLAALAGLIFIWLLQILTGRSTATLSSPSSIVVILALFIIVNILAALIGMVRHSIFLAIADADWILWIGFFIFGLHYLRPNNIRSYVGTLYLVSLYLALNGVYRLITEQGVIGLTTGGERYIPGSNSLLIASGLIVSLLVWTTFRLSTRTRLLLLTCMSIQAFAIILSFNRQTWVALTISLAFGFLMLLRRKLLKVLWRFGWVALVLFIFYTIVATLDVLPIDLNALLIRRVAGGDFRQLLDDPSVQFRFSAWSMALQGAREHPILGNGWGAPFEFSVYVTRTDSVQYFSSSPHNTYLWLSYKAGFLTMGLFLLFLATIFSKATFRYHSLARQHPEQAFWLAAFLMIGMVYAIGAIWWDYLSITYMSIPIWINLAALTVLLAQRTGKPGQSKSRDTGEPLIHP